MAQWVARGWTGLGFELDGCSLMTYFDVRVCYPFDVLEKFKHFWLISAKIFQCFCLNFSLWMLQQLLQNIMITFIKTFHKKQFYIIITFIAVISMDLDFTKERVNYYYINFCRNSKKLLLKRVSYKIFTLY